MEQLDLLCKLEKHHNSLNIYNEKLKSLKENISVDEIGKKIENKEKKLKELIKNKENTKKKLRKIEQDLKEYNYKIKELEDKLYSGNTKNITQLEKWNMEKDNLKNIINDTEINILELMEKIDEIENQYINLEKSLEKIKEKYEKQLIEHEEIEKSLNKNIKRKIQNINNLEKSMETNILKRYNLIRRNKGTAVAKVVDSICSGCNTQVSTYIEEGIKNNREIIYCELCGRILCKQ